MEENLIVYVLSDSIGETAEQVLKAAISQFDCKKFKIKKFPYISDEDHIKEIIYDAKDKKSMIVFTMVVAGLRDVILREAKKYDIEAVDIMTPLMNPLEKILKKEPRHEAGLIRKLDERYFKKVEAIEFAVKYDDGKDPRGLKKADIVLVGISRTSKTPLSMYLAHKNIKVANVPLVPEVPVTEEIFKIDPKKIIGLTTDPIKLNEIRQERLKALGLGGEANYASMDRILKELEYAEGLMKRLGCPVINVANKAVEESANIILELIRKVNM